LSADPIAEIEVCKLTTREEGATLHPRKAVRGSRRKNVEE